ncbi:hypothetical protein BDQ17DRAFT_1391057 [Cyathus striatus]|nr:hypothetical protein BDQ17DRAFT_1391057 [Cyathus striatus]
MRQAAPYGRHRQSVVEIENELHNIFASHPESHINDSGEPVIPADSLVDVFRLLSDQELSMLKVLLASNPGLEVTPQILLQFIAEKTKSSPPLTPNAEQGSSGEEDERGRADEWDDLSFEHHRRSSSNESNGQDAYYRSGSRPSSRGPPTTPLNKSLFDSERRQRSTPLGNNAPSSWSRRPAPASRRKSDAGSKSDSEVRIPYFLFFTLQPCLGGSDTFSPISSPSRPHSRTRSQPQSAFNSFIFDDHGYTSPEENHTLSSSDFNQSINSLPRPQDEYTDSEDEDSLGLVMDRDIASGTLASRLSEHEMLVEEMEGRLEEKNSELSAAKREEKELRSKERQHTSTIAVLEMEVSKLSKQVEHSRATYASLQKQYQEQCALSEKYRDDLRQREESIRNLRESISLHEIESGKWAREQQTYEDRLVQLENELAVAQQAHEQLNEQKQENLLLKETIDRMRFDMDELRNSAAGGLASGSGHASAANTVSKSLGAELLGKMGEWEDDEENGESETTAVEEGDSDEEEDVIQTIITRKKRTEPERTIVRQSFASQTPPEPVKDVGAAQTDPEPIPPPRVTIEMEVQTMRIQGLRTRSPSPHDESLASSSSTIIPPTPKAHNRHLEELHGHLDQPPAYNQINVQEREERDWQVASETLKKWHGDTQIPFEGVSGGVTPETIEEWKALKEELGVDCTVIDKIIEASARVPRRGRLYNIYNTYIFGDKSNSLSLSGLASQAVAVMGVSAVVILAVTPYMVPQYNIPGGPTAYDRSAWSSFNTMQAGGEGFGHDGTAAVLGFLGALESARRVWQEVGLHDLWTLS